MENTFDDLWHNFTSLFTLFYTYIVDDGSHRANSPEQFIIAPKESWAEALALLDAQYKDLVW